MEGDINIVDCFQNNKMRKVLNTTHGVMKNCRVLVIGYEPYGEGMYPHLHDFVEAFRERVNLTYCGSLKRYQAYTNLTSPIALIKRKEKNVSQYLHAIWNINQFKSEQKCVAEDLANLMHKDKYTFIIAIDPVAWIIAARFAPISSKLIFWSYDMPSKDSVIYKNKRVRRIVSQCIRLKNKCDLWVIQNAGRSSVLNDLLLGLESPFFYFPVSLRDGVQFRIIASEKRSISKKEDICLAQITCSKGRGSDLLFQEIQNPQYDHITLMFEGSIANDMEKMMRNARHPPIVVRKHDRLSDFVSTIAKADIGFIAYRYGDTAHKYMSQSSGQVAEFTRLGIPLIVLENEHLGKRVEKMNAGCLINKISSLNDALEKIRNSYLRYSRGARALYESDYCLDNYVGSFESKLEEMIRRK